LQTNSSSIRTGNSRKWPEIIVAASIGICVGPGVADESEATPLPRQYSGPKYTPDLAHPYRIDDVEKSELAARFGGIDVLMNSAGVQPGMFGPAAN